MKFLVRSIQVVVDQDVIKAACGKHLLFRFGEAHGNFFLAVRAAAPKA